MHSEDDYVVVHKPAGVQVAPTVDNLLENVLACTAQVPVPLLFSRCSRVDILSISTEQCMAIHSATPLSYCHAYMHIHICCLVRYLLIVITLLLLLLLLLLACTDFFVIIQQHYCS